MKKDLKLIYENVKSPDIKIEGKYIFYKEKKYTENEWLKKICSFKDANKDDLILQNLSIKELPSTILFFFERNVSKTSKLGLIFPCIIFLLFSLISLTPFIFFQTGANFDFFKKMAFFVSIVFFLLGVIQLIKILGGEKAFITTVKGQTRIKQISKTTYQKMLNILKEKSKNEYYYFKEINCITETNKELKIREFNYGDLNDLFNVFKDNDVFKFLLGSEFKTIEDSYNFINKSLLDYKENKVFKLAIVVENVVIGYIGLSKMDLTNSSCQIIYAIGKEYWGNGYVSKAISLFVPWLKSKGKSLIIAGHVDENINSGKVLLKSGFERFEEKDYILNIHGVDKQIISYKFNDEKL